jgi:hypothetical protein
LKEREVAMFIHPLSNLRSIDRAIADLIENMEQYDASHPRAVRLPGMVDGLRSFKGQPTDRGVALSARRSGGTRHAASTKHQPTDASYCRLTTVHFPIRGRTS